MTENVFDPKIAAASFESLGGGSCDRLQNPYGCEFALFQRRLGVDSLGLLRWASIHPDRLIRAINNGFAGVNDPAFMVMNPGSRNWNSVQVSCGIFNAHTGLSREEYTAAEASIKFARSSAFLRDKLLRDLAEPTKIFVYRTADAAMPLRQVVELADAVERRGPGALLYVRLAEAGEAVFQIVIRSGNLLVATIDRFANPADPRQHNDAGWTRVCEAAVSAVAGLPG